MNESELDKQAAELKAQGFYAQLHCTGPRWTCTLWNRVLPLNTPEPRGSGPTSLAALQNAWHAAQQLLREHGKS